VFAVVLTMVIRLLLSPFIGEEAPFMLFTIAVLASAWYGELRSGLLATALSALVATYLLLVPFYHGQIAQPEELIRLALFVVAGTAIALVVEALHRTRHWLEQASIRLRQSEETLRLAQQAAHAGAWDWDIRTDTVT
jgi:K+-sensing histidine kinase KdpD